MESLDNCSMKYLNAGISLKSLVLAKTPTNYDKFCPTLITIDLNACSFYHIQDAHYVVMWRSYFGIHRSKFWPMVPSSFFTVRRFLNWQRSHYPDRITIYVHAPLSWSLFSDKRSLIVSLSVGIWVTMGPRYPLLVLQDKIIHTRRQNPNPRAQTVVAR